MVPSSLLFLLGDKKILVCLYIVQIYYAEHFGFLKLRALGSLHFLLEHSDGLNPIEAWISFFQTDLHYCSFRFVFPQSTSSSFYVSFILQVKINWTNWPAPNVWVFIAQLLEHCRANAEARYSPENFFGLICNCCYYNCDDHIFIEICISVVHIIIFKPNHISCLHSGIYACIWTRNVTLCLSNRRALVWHLEWNTFVNATWRIWKSKNTE